MPDAGSRPAFDHVRIERVEPSSCGPLYFPPFRRIRVHVFEMLEIRRIFKIAMHCYAVARLRGGGRDNEGS